MFDLTLLPAGQGDCVELTYGDPAAPRRILVDGGPARCYRHLSAHLSAIPAERRRIDLLVLTHVDGDHVEGVVKLVNDAGLAVDIGGALFNGYHQLPPDDYLGPAQGEMLSALLSARGIPANTAFGGDAVVRRAGAALPRWELPDGLVLTVLGPDTATLRALRPVWEKACRKAHIRPGSEQDALDLLAERPALNPLDSYLAEVDPAKLAEAVTAEDTSVTNASSIVLLAEFEGRRVLLTGDATPPVLTAGLERLLIERGLAVLDVDAVKLPHHGSRANVTHGVLDLVRAPAYLVSADGSYYSHPDAEAIARVITRRRGARLLFNYRTELTERWADEDLARRFGYRAEYPARESRGVVLHL